MTQGHVVHIFLVGTSIIRNFASSERIVRLPDELRELVKSWTRVIDDPRAREHLGRGVLFQELVNFAKEKPRQASAELNAYLSLIVDLGFKEFKADKVYLLHSDTYLCSLCARVLKEYLVSEAEVETIAVYGLGKIFEEGLANLFEGILRVARQHPHPDTVLLNATGGFKPESAIATLAAALGNATAVYYIHEAFRKAEIIERWRQRKSIIKEPCAIIAPAGMLGGGAAVFYLTKLYDDEKNGIFIVGFQVPGTPGRMLLEERKAIIKGKVKRVKMRAEKYHFSSHIDKSGFKSLFSKIKGDPKFFVIHGNKENSNLLAKMLKEDLGFDTYLPKLGEEFEVDSHSVIRRGRTSI